MNLEQTSLSVTEQFPSAQQADLLRREQLLERFGKFAFGGLGIVLVAAICAIIYLIFTKMVLSGQQPFSGIFLILFIVFAVLALSYVIFTEDLKDRKKKIRPVSVDYLEISNSTEKLLEPSSFEPIESVTESTTDLLHIETRTSKLD